ncbi:hypothetical protein [Clostridium brassicae]|uniref:Xanthine/uracil/vitamin C permease n=1 Tax=Clostridium brassicae TaxID=2999072 RepID=A0ABT4DBU2_9CLOT|nr:hypothetical protein [Clostridium brassicae]MCY6959765.1 hypothetical protein [Clostridium brassicae]
MAIKREYGKEQPYIPAGPFKIRIPFVHYKFEWADYIQGLFMCAVCLGAIPMLQEYLGMPFEIAMAIVLLNGILYCAHVFLGDPVVPGWVTPAIPLLMLHISQFQMGIERMHALIAFELTLGILAIILGITGLGKKIVSIVPNAMQSGIILGAGIAAVNVIFVKGARFDKFPISIVICVGIGFYLLFSNHFRSIRENNKILKIVSDLGILPVILLAVIVGPLAGETPWPHMEWGITKPEFGTLWKEWTVFGMGFPPLSMFIKSIPMVLSAYIVLFGDMIQANALLEDAEKVRPDEKIDYNANRTHIIFGLRNTIMSIIGPDLTMCGPLWAAMQVVICERYKKGREAMDSISGGAGSFRFGTLTGYLLLPIVSLCKPILGIALACTMLIQGYVSVRVGVMKSRTFNDLGIAGIMAAVLATRGAAWGLATGIILCLLIQLGNKPNLDNYIFEETKEVE